MEKGYSADPEGQRLALDTRQSQQEAEMRFRNGALARPTADLGISLVAEADFIPLCPFHWTPCPQLLRDLAMFSNHLL